MSIDGSTLAQLLTMSALNTISYTDPQPYSPSSGDTGDGFADLLHMILLMQNSVGNQASGGTGNGIATEGAYSAADFLREQLAAGGLIPAGTLGTVQNQNITAGSDLTQSSGVQDGISPYKDVIQEMSDKYSVPSKLIESVIEAESGGNPKATSPAGAQGLMQLMPETAASLGVADAYDPIQNIEGGTKYLRSMLDRFGGNVTLALAAYNAGAGAVAKYNGVPPFPETQTYVGRVLGNLGSASA
jgi:hypothetical protein